MFAKSNLFDRIAHYRPAGNPVQYPPPRIILGLFIIAEALDGEVAPASLLFPSLTRHPCAGGARVDRRGAAGDGAGSDVQSSAAERVPAFGDVWRNRRAGGRDQFRSQRLLR